MDGSKKELGRTYFELCPTYFKISQTYFWLYLNALKINKILYGQMRTWN